MRKDQGKEHYIILFFNNTRGTPGTVSPEHYIIIDTEWVLYRVHMTVIHATVT